MTLPPLPEPTGSQWLDWDDKSSTYEALYTADQMIAYGAACAAAERERCAQVCDEHASSEGIAQKCAAAIRAQG